MTNPVSALTVPVAHEPVPDLVQRILEITSYLSLSSLARRFLTEVTGHDPLEDVTHYFAGDWSQVSEAADALRNLGEFHRIYADELDIATRAVRSDWDGNAADAAVRYLNECASAVARQAESFDSVADEYDHTARAMWDLADGVGSLICDAIDLALIMAASAAVGTATAWTGFGALVGALGAGGAGLALAAKVLEIADTFNDAVLLTEAASAAVRGVLGQMASFEEVRLPASYDHPFAVQPVTVQP